MVTRTVSTTYDDLYGEPNAATIRFSFNDAEYEIDLLNEGKELMEALQRFIEAGRRTGTKEPERPAPVRGSKSSAAKVTHARMAAIREWAGLRGIYVGEKGVIKRDIQDAYDAAVRSENG